MEEKLLQAVRAQETVCLNLRESLHRRHRSCGGSQSFQYERAKLIGMLDILDALSIDRTEFKWIFNA